MSKPIKRIARKLTKDEIAEIKQAFDYFDQEKKGELGLAELKLIAKHLHREMTDKQLLKIIRKVNRSNKKDVIIFDDLVEYMSKAGFKPPSMAHIEETFSLFDRDNSGYITINDFYDIMRRLNINFSKKTILKMVEKIDTDKNCRITLDEFMNLFY